MRRLMTASLWLIAPTYAAWRSARPRVSRPLEPFRRWNPKATRWWIGSLLIGLVIIGLAFAFEIPIVGVLGVGYAFAAIYKLAARLVVPKQLVQAEMDFNLLTSLSTVTRVGLWVGFLASLVLAKWTAAFGLGVAASLLTLSTAATVLVAQRIAAKRRTTGVSPD